MISTPPHPPTPLTEHKKPNKGNTNTSFNVRPTLQSDIHSVMNSLCCKTAGDLVCRHFASKRQEHIRDFANGTMPGNKSHKTDS